MQWEYLRVLIATDSTSSHYQPKGVFVVGEDGQLLERRKQQGDKSHSPVVSRLLKELGDDGWELAVGMPRGPSDRTDVLYFKRPKGPR